MTKTLKQFLKPDWRKIAVFVILFIIPFFIEPLWTGFPLGFIPILCIELGSCVLDYSIINYPFLMTDLIIWYLLSCLIVWIYDKFRKKKN